MGQVRHESQEHMIEKLDPNETSYKIIVDKINELIDIFAYHYHVTADTKFNTTFPRIHKRENDNDGSSNSQQREA